MLGLPHVVAVGLITTGLSGCVLLDLLLGVPPGFDPDATFPPFPVPSAAATFTTGRATIAIGAETILLDELAAGGSIEEGLGTHVVWTDGEGWYLTFYGYGGLGGFPGSSSISLDRIVEGAHWTTFDPSRCLATADRVDATGVAGSATCRGLMWSDYFGAFSGLGLPREIPGQPAFDAEITFEAH